MSFYEAYNEVYIINVPLDRLINLDELEVGGWDEDEWQMKKNVKSNMMQKQMHGRIQ